MTVSPQDEAEEYRLRLQQSQALFSSRSARRPEHERHHFKKLSKLYGSSWSEMVRTCLDLQSRALTKLGEGAAAGDLSASPLPEWKHHDGLPSEVTFWWTTRRALEQSTHAAVAAVKAEWFADEAVHDICTGIGGDAVQFANRGPVHAVERDPLTAAMAWENIRNHRSGDHAFSVHCCELADYELPPHRWVHVDPDRRVSGRKALDPDSFSPTWNDICNLIRAATGAVVKIAPATKVPDSPIPESEFHRAWFEIGGSVREQDLLWGEVCDRAGFRQGERSATVIRADGSRATFQAEVTSASLDGEVMDMKQLEGCILVDPRSVVRAAGLTESFAAKFGCHLLAGPSGFLCYLNNSSGMPEEMEELAAVGSVLWIGPCDDRKLRKELRARDFYPETIKVRGSDHDPVQMIKRYRECGQRPIRLWIGRLGRRVFAAMTKTQEKS